MGYNITEAKDNFHLIVKMAEDGHERIIKRRY